MTFLRTKLSLGETAIAADGVISACQHLRLIEANQLVEDMLEKAQARAEKLVHEASVQADAIVAAARCKEEKTAAQSAASAKALLSHIQSEWHRVMASIEPTAVAVARLAIARVCDTTAMAERVEIAARAAMRELPEKPIRIRIPTGSGSSIAHLFDEMLDVAVDDRLQEATVCVEGEHSACEASFDEVQAVVTSFLDSWVHRALSLVKNHQGPIVQSL